MNAMLRIHQINSLFEHALKSWIGALLLLLLRLYVGWIFFHSGLIKISDWPATLGLFQNEYHVPLLPPGLAAVVGAFGELTFPVFLFVGLLTRPAALGLFAVNLMAVISYPQLFEFECPAAIQQHFFWGSGILVLAIFGAGMFSLDALIGRKR